MRLTREEQAKFDKCREHAIEMYKRLRRTSPLITREDVELIIQESALGTDDKLMTYKQFSANLKGWGVIRARDWKRLHIVRTVRIYGSSRANKQELVKRLAERYKTAGRIVDCTKKDIRDILAKNGCSLGIPKQMDWIESAVKQAEGGETLKQVALNAGKSTSAVAASLQRYGAKVSGDYYTRNIKYDYRDLDANSDENLHLMGLVWADGSINQKRLVHIRLSITDKSYLESIASSLVLQGEVPTVSEIETKDSYKRYSDKSCVGLSITRSIYAERLLALGKSTDSIHHESELPKNLEHTLFGAFLRGFFDGDGTVNYWQDTKGRYHFGLSFSVGKSFGDDLNKYVTDYFGISGDMIKDKSIYKLSFIGLSKVLILIGIMFRQANISLLRKRTTCEEIWAKGFNIHHTNFNELKHMPFDQLIPVMNKVLSRITSHDFDVQLRNTSTLKEFKGPSEKFIEETGMDRNQFTRLIRGERKSAHGWEVVSHTRDNKLKVSN